MSTDNWPSEYIALFRPSLIGMIRESWWSANRQTARALKCYICRRMEDKFFVTLTPVFDESLKDVRHICPDHGGVFWNCFKGESFIQVTKPYWQRWVRNTIQSLVSSVIIPARFVWFFINTAFMWYIGIYLWWLWKQYKTSR